MDLLAVLAHLSVIHILMAMIPGPNTIVVSYCSAGMSRRQGLTAAAGVAVATLIWVSLSLAGIGVLLMQAGDLYRFIRLAGAAYLIFVGVKLLLPRSATEAPADTKPLYRSPFLAGVLTTLSNPKSAVFWTSVFALVVPSHAPVWFYGAVVALITLQSFIWYAIVALAMSSPFSRKHYARLTGVLNRVAGAFLLFFGIRIANDVRGEFVRAT